MREGEAGSGAKGASKQRGQRARAPRRRRERDSLETHPVAPSDKPPPSFHARPYSLYTGAPFASRSTGAGLRVLPNKTGYIVERTRAVFASGTAGQLTRAHSWSARIHCGKLTRPHLVAASNRGEAQGRRSHAPAPAPRPRSSAATRRGSGGGCRTLDAPAPSPPTVTEPGNAYPQAGKAAAQVWRDRTRFEGAYSHSLPPKREAS